MPPRDRIHGWIPDVPDQRDLLYMTYARALKAPAKLPTKVNLLHLCSAVEDQGELGSCTANALAGNIEFLQRKNMKSNLEEFSRLYLYYNERAREGTINEDAGAMLRTGIKSLVHDGICSELIWPYKVSKFTSKPPAKAYSDGATHQVTKYYRLLSLTDMLGCLASGFPFVFGFAVYESFMSETVAESGKVPMPKKGEKMLGGHAVMAVGYTLSPQAVLVRNSWGEGWGLDGYFWMPFNYLKTRNLSDDFWTIRAGEDL